MTGIDPKSSGFAGQKVPNNTTKKNTGWSHLFGKEGGPVTRGWAEKRLAGHTPEGLQTSHYKGRRLGRRGAIGKGSRF